VRGSITPSARQSDAKGILSPLRILNAQIHELLMMDILITDFTVDDSFWKKVFVTDKVYIVKYIRDLFRQEKYFKEDYGCLFSLNVNGIAGFIKNK